MYEEIKKTKEFLVHYTKTLHKCDNWISLGQELGISFTYLNKIREKYPSLYRYTYVHQAKAVVLNKFISDHREFYESTWKERASIIIAAALRLNCSEWNNTWDMANLQSDNHRRELSNI